MTQLVARLQPIQELPFKFPHRADTDAYQPAANLTVARGTVMGQITTAGATYGQVKPYATGNADGSQTPVGISLYDFSTDASGNVTIGTGTTFGLAQGHTQTIPLYICGSFRKAELVGMDAGALTALFARSFVTADGTGYVRIP